MTSPPPIPDDKILAQAGWVRALARRLARDSQGAEDLVQGTLAAALERPPAQGRPLRPWLTRVVTNMARKERRGALRRKAREEEWARHEAAPAADQMLAELEEQLRLVRLVGQLSEPYRTVILRRYYRGQSAAAIARAMGVPAATVRSQLARGLERLRAAVERRCDGDVQRALGVLALASGSRDGLFSSALSTSTQLIAMNTGTKVAALAAGAALVVGALGLHALIGNDGVQPEERDGLRATESELENVDLAVAPTAAQGAREVVETGGFGPGDGAGRVPEELARPITLVTARAVDVDLAPIAGAWLEVSSEDGLKRAFPRSAPSGADGRLELELPKVASFQYWGHDIANAYLALRAPAHATHFFIGHVVRGGTKDQGDVMLTAGGGVSGRVIYGGGAPVAAALVVGTSALVGGNLHAARLAGPGTDGGRPTVLTDANGRFELAGLHLGETSIWAHADTFLWTVSDPVLVEEGALVHGLTLTLEPVPADARIVGRVVDPGGLPVAGAEVLYLQPGVWDHSTVESGADGRFQIDVALRAAHVLEARDPQRRYGPSVHHNARPGGDELVLELTPRRELTAHVVDEQGRPIEDAWAIAFTKSNDHFGNSAVHTDAEGRATIVAKGEPFFVNVGEEGYESKRLGRFDPGNLPTEEVLFELEPQPLIRGRVMHGEHPVAGARVELAEVQDFDSVEIYKGFPLRFSTVGDTVTESDAEGRFLLPMDSQFNGTYTILVEKEGFALAEVALLRIDPTEAYDGVEVRLTSGGTLEGFVLVAPNRSREGVVIAASRGDGRPRVTRTDAEGRYRLERLTAGSWHVEDRLVEPEGRVVSMASKEEAPFDWHCEVFEGQTTAYDLDLRWQAELRVEGRLAFDGAGAGGWTAVLEAGDHADRPYDLRPSVVDTDGRFSVEALPGPGTLVLRSPTGSGPASMVKAKIVVEAERRPVELAFETGVLVGRIPESGARLRVYHRVDEKTHLETAFEADDEGAFRLEGVPAGEVSFQRHEVGKYGLGWYSVKHDIVIVAGETTTVE